MPDNSVILGDKWKCLQNNCDIHHNDNRALLRLLPVKIHSGFKSYSKIEALTQLYFNVAL